MTPTRAVTPQRRISEGEAEFSTYIVGSHFGFNFQEDSGAYIKSSPDDAKAKSSNPGKENIDRVMNNMRWLINEISTKIA
ncbi:MAG: hypothetical protein ACYCSG_06705 [Thermoplasmataceae archaeon]